MERTLGPKRLGDIIKETFTIYGRNFWKFVGISSIVTIPLLVMLVVLFVVFLLPSFPNFSESIFEEIAQFIPQLIIGFTIFVIIALVLQVLGNGAMLQGTAEQYFRQPIGISRSYGFSWRRLPNALGAIFIVSISSLLTVAVFLIPLFISMPGFLNESHEANGVLIFLGILLAFIGYAAVVYMATIWHFAYQSAMLQRNSPVAALKNSYELVKDNFWRVFGIVLVLGLIVGGINLVLRFVPIIGIIIFIIFTPPITAIGENLLYFDLRVRKQGYTIENLSDELGQPAPTTSSVVSPQL